MIYKTVLQALIVLIAGLPVLPAWCDTPGPAGSTPPTLPAPQERSGLPGQESATTERPDSGRHFDAKKRERMIQMLQLDEATRAKLLQRLEQLDQKGEELRRQRHEAFVALREQAKGLRSEIRRGDRKSREADKAASPGAAADEGALKAALERVYAVEEAVSGLSRERLQIIRDLLAPEQQVKFLLYRMKFHKEMRERLEREHGALQGGQPKSGDERAKP